MSEEFHELFSLAAKYFFRQYKKKGGSQGELAKQIGVTQSYLSSVINGSRTASLDLQSDIAKILFGPYDQFLEAGRLIKEGKDPQQKKTSPVDDGVERLIAKLTYYVMDHKRIEGELQKTKNFYETIVEKQQTGILVMDRNHQVSYANRYMEELSGIDPELIKNTKPHNAAKEFTGLEIDSFVEIYNETNKTLQPTSYRSIQTTMPDGRYMYISGWMIPQVKDGAFDGMICTMWDTTTSYILRNLFTLSFDFSPDGIGIIQQTKPGELPAIYSMNKRFKEIFDLHEIDPSVYSFKKILKRMADKMKNGETWLKTAWITSTSIKKLQNLL
jgi:PAS domain S-box-containing protein